MTPPMRPFDLAALTELDVRDDLRRGGEPLAGILAAAEALPPGGVLHLRTPFEPAPLYTVLGQRGFVYHREAFAADDWSSWFWRDASPPPDPLPEEQSPREPVPEGVMDLRDLPAPEPLVAILAQLTRSDEAFEVMLPMDPPMLDAILASHGWYALRLGGHDDGVRLRLLRERPGG